MKPGFPNYDWQRKRGQVTPHPLNPQNRKDLGWSEPQK